MKGYSSYSNPRALPPPSLDPLLDHPLGLVRRTDDPTGTSTSQLLDLRPPASCDRPIEDDPGETFDLAERGPDLVRVAHVGQSENKMGTRERQRVEERSVKCVQGSSRDGVVRHAPDRGRREGDQEGDEVREERMAVDRPHGCRL